MGHAKPVVLVTGGGTGIGRGAVLAFAAAGYDVAINYSKNKEAAADTSAAARKLGAEAILIQCDVSDDPAVREMVAEVERHFGRLDVLVNNAGTTSTVAASDFDGVTAENWDRVFAVNVRGMFQVTRAAVPLLKAAGNGCVVNTASIVGLRPGPQPLAYATSKAAVVNLTKVLAYHLGPEIRVNAVAPGWMEGDWMKRMLNDKYDSLMERRARHTPLKRCVTADDVAETILNLARSNRFVTGEIVVIDGGFSSST